MLEAIGPMRTLEAEANICASRLADARKQARVKAWPILQGR